MDQDKEKENAAEEAEKKEEGNEDSDAEGDDKAKDDSKEEAKTPTTTTDWPLRGIKEPHDNDVLYGRGGGTNHHPGNKRYRKMVEDRKLDYVNSKRLDKPLVALEIIREWRAQDPPGRFLKMDNDGLWNDVGDKKAREKTSQALREKAPQIRKQQEEEKMKEQHDKDDKEDVKEAETKTTRFAEGTNTESKPKSDLKRAVLARDHSLGREYVEEDKPVSLEGFSWQDPFQSASSMDGEKRRTSGQGSSGPGYRPTVNVNRPREEYSPPQGDMGPPPSGYTVPPPASRYSGPTYSSGGPPPPPGDVYRTHSGEMPPPSYRVSSQGSNGPSDYYSSAPGGEELRQRNSSGRYDTWAQQPPSSTYNGYPAPQRSGSWSYGPAEAVAPIRENSLSLNPLTNASVSQPAPRAAFDSTRSHSGFWEDPNLPSRTSQHHYAPSYRSSGTSAPYTHNRSPPREYRDTNGTSPMKVTKSGGSPPYSVDPAIAQTWSGQSEEEISRVFDRKQVYRKVRRESHLHGDEDGGANKRLPRPAIVKRHTSNQNETIETKRDLVGPSVKRAALNRDSSAAANRLKETYLPEYYGENKTFDPEHEVNVLSNNLKESTLNNDGSSKPKPQALKDEERSSTLNMIAMELMVKPEKLGEGGRSSTIDALNLALEDDPILKAEAIDSSTMEDVVDDLKNTEKPKLGRLSTVDITDMVNEPIDEENFSKDIW